VADTLADNRFDMTLLDTLHTKARARNARVAFPEAEDGRILQAARQLADRGLAQPLLIGNTDKIEQAAQAAGTDLSGLAIVDPATNARSAHYADLYLEVRPSGNPKVARRMVTRPLFHAALMVRAGDADSLVAGAATATGRVIEAGLLGLGQAQGIETPSSFFLMQVPNFLGQGPRDFLYADCAVNIDPSASQLADIAVASARSAARLLDTAARVALLSFSTKGSAQHAAVDKVTEALALVQAREPDIVIDGELQADSALVERVANAKLTQPGPVAGQANVLIFPTLDAGNIAYKLTQYMAGATALGPFLQGFARPLSDLSRGATVEDIVNTAAVVAAQS
jgi:phosphate acetyltransferase